MDSFYITLLSEEFYNYFKEKGFICNRWKSYNVSIEASKARNIKMLTITIKFKEYGDVIQYLPIYVGKPYLNNTEYPHTNTLSTHKDWILKLICSYGPMAVFTKNHVVLNGEVINYGDDYQEPDEFFIEM